MQINEIQVMLSEEPGVTFVRLGVGKFYVELCMCTVPVVLGLVHDALGVHHARQALAAAKAGRLGPVPAELAELADPEENKFPTLTLGDTELQLTADRLRVGSDVTDVDYLSLKALAKFLENSLPVLNHPDPLESVAQLKEFFAPVRDALAECYRAEAERFKVKAAKKPASKSKRKAA